MKSMLTLGGALLGLTLTATASAGIQYDYSGAGFELSPTGTPTNVSEIVVGDNVILSDITVSLNDLIHSWAGDLTITVEHVESGSIASLVTRVGFTGTGFGDSSNYGGTYNFNDAFTGDLWQAAAGGDSTFTIPAGDYFASGAGGSQISLLSAFSGINIAGTWRLTVSDAAGGDGGSLGGWGLSIVGVPAPAALAMFGLAGLAPRRRRQA